MKNIIFIIVTLIFGYAKAAEEGHINSLYLHNNETNFDYTKIKNLIVFGDSYSAANPDYNSVSYDGKNRSGGKNWALNLIDILDIQMYDLAFDGAAITNDYTKIKNKHPLTNQYEIFNSKMIKGKKSNNWNSENTLFTFWFGINDLIRTTKSSDETIQQGQDVLFDIANKIYDDGARNIIFFYLPPFNYSPYFLNVNNSRPDLPQFIESFNKSLKERVEEYHRAHPLANVFIYNAFDEFNFLLENHQNLNVTDIERPCNEVKGCVRSTFFWNDDMHPTDNIHSQIAMDIHQFLNDNSVNKVTLSKIKSSSIKKMNNKDYSFIALIIFILYFVFY